MSQKQELLSSILAATDTSNSGGSKNSPNIQRLLRELEVSLEKIAKETGRQNMRLDTDDLDFLAGRLADMLHKANTAHSLFSLLRLFSRKRNL